MRRLLIASVVCVAFAAVVVVASAEDESSPPTGLGEAPVASIQPEAKDALAVLEDHRTSVDVMSNGTAEVLDRKPEFGANPDLSRLAIGNATRSVFVIPARDHVCVAFTAGEAVTLTCPDTKDLAEGKAGPLTVGLDGDAAAVLGLVPDGVESVVVGYGESSSTTVEVKDNAYYFSVPAGTYLKKLSYSAPSGEIDFTLTDPRLAFD